MLLTQTSHVDYEELCRLDVLGLADTPTNDQGSVYAEFKEQLVRDPEGWYETGLPWRGNHPVLPNNKEGSLRRLKSLDKKLERQELTNEFADIIEEQKNSGSCGVRRRLERWKPRILHTTQASCAGYCRIYKVAHCLRCLCESV